MSNFRIGSISATPGLDLLVPTVLASDGAQAMVLVQDALIVHRWCYPPRTQAENMRGFGRPTFLPGHQNVSLAQPQPGCVNGTDAPLWERCFSTYGTYYDLGLVGADRAPNDHPVPNNYIIWLVRVQYGCTGVMPEDCVIQRGPINCFYYLLQLERSPAAQQQDQAQELGMARVTDPKLDSSWPEDVDAAQSQSQRQKQAQPRQGHGDGESSSHRNVLLPVLVCVLGGAAIVAVAVAASVFLRRSRSGSGASKNDTETVGGSKAHSCKPEAEVGEVRVAPISRLVNGGVTPSDEATISDYPEEGGTGPSSLDEMHVVVNPLTPPRADLALGVECGNEVTLLPILIGKGSFGRVVQGLYGGQRVAVKLLPCEVLDRSSAAAAAPRPAAAEGVSVVNTVAAPRSPVAAGSPAAAGSAGKAGSAAAMGLSIAAALEGLSSFDMASRLSPKGVPVPYSVLTVGAQDATASGGCGAKDGADGNGSAGAGGEGGKDRRAGARELATFAQEVEVLGRCRHPNVVRLLAACLGPPQPCLVMELLETSLDKIVHVRPAALLPMPTVLQIAIDIVRGLEYLHPTIVHRDLKPANVLVNMSGRAPVAKLSDFGLSRMRTTVLNTRHPEAGTPAYMAPECFDTQNLIITHQADMYSFAVILWEMLTGLLPWYGCTPVAVAYTVTLLGERLPLHNISPDRCPPKLARLMQQCFDTEPRRRPAAAELAKELLLLLKKYESGAARPAVAPSEARLHVLASPGAGAGAGGDGAAAREGPAPQPQPPAAAHRVLGQLFAGGGEVPPVLPGEGACEGGLAAWDRE